MNRDHTVDPSPARVKIIVAGGFGAGKTTFVGAISEITPLITEALITAAGTAVDDRGGRDPGIDAGLLVYERDRALLAAFGRLGGRCQRVLRLTTTDPAPSYDEISAALDMPVGGIGPTRGQCLAELRGLLG